MTLRRTVTLALGLGLVACTTAHADRIAIGPEPGGAPFRVESPYQVEILDEYGAPLKSYQHRKRFYVLGNAGQRYTIRVNNPTYRRVEAVISVDGLDVIDGKTADVGKRGYIVPAWGELRVDGFRTSTEHVAAFRFSSVASSYAGRKGQARNVGVIGVALFEEKAAPEIARPEIPTHRPPHHHRERRPSSSQDSLGWSDDDGEAEHAPPAPPAGSTRGGASSGAPSAAPGAARKSADAAPALRHELSGEACCEPRPQSRPGLGTEFGERRYSAVSWTTFERATPSRPSALAELRYNDSAGLQALGIRVHPVSPDDLTLRETASPFPGGSFAQPPR